MQRVDFPPLIQELIRQLRRMPGVGPRSAERIALWIVQRKDARADQIAEAILKTVSGIRSCTRCGFFSEAELCVICADPGRDARRLCVVEQPTDILSLERSGAFHGLYHSLGGRLSPLDHVGPEDLRIDSLLHRVRQERPDELIFALSLDVEGEATLSYLGELLKPEGVNITRIAQGLPAGSGLESADELTLARAFSGRTAFER
ncbi:MAG TPA: recombination mediator RecR [Chthoniobacterales bacterium]|nr:recombination mediator RecR [Chthoniobacterales bacterium]